MGRPPTPLLDQQPLISESSPRTQGPVSVGPWRMGGRGPSCPPSVYEVAPHSKPSSHEVLNSVTNPDETTQVVTKWRMTNPERDLSEDQLRYLSCQGHQGCNPSCILQPHIHLYGDNLSATGWRAYWPMRLTSVVARVVMDHWAALFLCSLEDSGFKVWEFHEVRG